MRVKLFFFVFLSILKLYSQDTIFVNGVPKINKVKKGLSGSENLSPLKKDDYLFELSYGYPFVPLREASFFGLDLFSNTKLKKTESNINHICARTEYQLNEEFSVGLEFTYAETKFNYTRSYYNSTYTNTSITDSTFTAKASKIRFLAKMGYHFNISEKFDAYGTAGFGFKSFKYETRDAVLLSTNFVNDVIPIAVRLSVGGRFFLKENIAIHVEGGIGGPMMQMGLTYKMH
ncbi:MAG: outer membrane beta-barrel protein [Bacteroidota bacterium]|nr:outer membrane beta-barrel protein [Bacteroidota bacterium]